MAEVYIDDVDASVAYSGDWQSSTDMRSRDNTIHFSNSVNSQASLTFTGISVMAYGVVRATETPQSSYTLDGGDPTVFQSTPRVISQYGVILYTSPSLRNGQHNLVITNLGNGSLFIDYFVIVTAGTASTSPSTSTTINLSPTSSIRPGTTSSTTIGTTSSSNSNSNSSTSTSLSSLGSLRSSEPASSSNVPSAITASSGDTILNSAPGATSKNSRHIAAIIGSLAALAIVAGFLIVFLLLRRRRRRKKEFESWIINSFSGGAVVPTATSFPRQISEELPPFPPRYAMSEPPAYDANTQPAAQAGDSQRFSSGGGFRKLEKGSMITTTQSSGGTPTSSNERNNGN